VTRFFETSPADPHPSIRCAQAHMRALVVTWRLVSCAGPGWSRWSRGERSTAGRTRCSTGGRPSPPLAGDSMLVSRPRTPPATRQSGVIRYNPIAALCHAACPSLTTPPPPLHLLPPSLVWTKEDTMLVTVTGGQGEGGWRRTGRGARHSEASSTWVLPSASSGRRDLVTESWQRVQPSWC
jgi:hypothetical protein